MPAHTIPSGNYVIAEAGVDYLTCTAPRSAEYESFLDASQAVIQAERNLGNEVKPAHWRNYEGYRSGGAFAGIRYDGWIAVLSSDTAHDHYQTLLPLCANVSRIDLQTTLHFDRSDPQRLRDYDAQMDVRSRGRQRGGKHLLMKASKGGDSLYVNERTSAFYGRIYDKGQEQRTHKPGVRVRWEAELKDYLALQAVKKLRANLHDKTQIVSMVSSLFQRRGAPTYSDMQAIQWSARVGQSSTVEQKLAWLSKATSKTIRSLIDKGMLEEVILALGLQEHVQPRERKRSGRKTKETPFNGKRHGL